MAGEETTKHHFGTVNFERRRHPRFSINLPVEYWKINRSLSGLSRTGDISEGGLLLYISEQLEVGQELNLKLFFNSELGFKSIEARMQVAWADFSSAKESGRRVGLKFVETCGEDMKKLKVFLDNLVHLKTHFPLNPSPGLSGKTR
jgi:c-di-GMP-binding flagellar brake protein YcgR